MTEKMTEKILVIEDERLTRKNLISFLTSEGFDTLEASNGRIGIELAQTHLPDLIICDILMPELDGYDVLITLQQQLSTAAIPFIFLTVSATEDGFRQGLALGADDYLSKPVTSDQLRAAIAAQLRKAKSSLDGLNETFVEASSDGESTLYNYTDIGALPAIDPTSSTSQPVANNITSAKATLLETLCPALKQRLMSLRQEVEEVQTLMPNNRSAQRLRDEFAQLLSLINEISVVQKALTPDNAMDLLTTFSNMVKDVERNPGNG